MTRYPDPSETEQNKFLRRLYFGQGHDYLLLCLERAYLDMCRTAHGISQFPSAYSAAITLLHQRLSQLASQKCHLDSERFDKWHESICLDLVASYQQHDYRLFSIGQAQKWINMAFKYVYVIGRNELPGFASFYSLCHIPIDNIIIKHSAFAGAPRFKCAWSRITTYDSYLAYQHWVRKSFHGSSPLAVEFRLWQGTPAAA